MDGQELLTAVPILALMWARGCGMLVALPVLGSKAGQGWSVRFPIAMAIALPSFAQIYSLPIPELTLLKGAWLALREFAIGALCGAFFLPLFVVPRTAGALVDQQAGATSIQLFDPATAEGATTPFADLFEQCALYVFVLTGGLSVLGEIYAYSCAAWPVGAADWPELRAFATMLMPDGFVALFVRAVGYAAPYVAVLLLCEYSIGLIGRTAPQINVVTTSVALKMWLALVVIYLGGSHALDAIPRAAERALQDGIAFLSIDTNWNLSQEALP
ncbi:type III secretory pathway component EscT [Burkholderia ambifaria]|nr:flagellar biosynthetic protein FliR [Burkholderia ambifaria]MDR6504014.1 type III secretory pathway component EscT [Burkholderia ambifaria]